MKNLFSYFKLSAEVIRPAVMQWRWHLNEVLIKTGGETHFFGCAVIHESEVCESSVTKTQDHNLTQALNRLIGCFLFITIFVASLGQSLAQSNSLRVGVVDLPPSLGNPYASVGLPSGHFWGSLYDGLTQISTTGDVTPSLALSWEQTQPTQWQFMLRQDVRFHNGAPFNAQDVVTTIQYLQSAEAARYLIANEVKNIASVRALSEHVVEINTLEPDVILPRRVSLIMVIEGQSWLQLGAEAYARAPIGTGPFAFVRWGKGNSSAVLSASDTAIRSAKDVKNLTMVAVPNAVAREQALLSGEFDLIENINADSVAAIENAGFDIHVHPRSQVISLALPNVARGESPLNSYEVRQALNIAVDRFVIAEQIYGGLVEAASQGAVTGTVGFNPDLKPFPYDPPLARRMLADAGYPDGFPMTIAILQVDGSGGEIAYQKVAQDLTAIGVSATIRAMPAPEFLRRFARNDWGPYDAFSLLWNSEPIRDAGRTLEYFSCLRPQPFFCDEDVAKAIVKSRAESDPEARKASLQKIMARMKELAPAIWLNNTMQITASRPHVANIQMGTNGLRFEDMVIQP